MCNVSYINVNLCWSIFGRKTNKEYALKIISKAKVKGKVRQRQLTFSSCQIREEFLSNLFRFTVAVSDFFRTKVGAHHSCALKKNLLNFLKLSFPIRFSLLKSGHKESSSASGTTWYCCYTM